MDSKLLQIIASLIIGIIMGTAIGYVAFYVAPTEEPEAIPFKIGVVLPLTGTTQGLGMRSNIGLELALEDFPYVLGNRPVELIIEDYQSEVDPGVESFRKLIDIDGVSIILAGTSSAVAQAACPYAMEKHVPVIGSTQTSPANREIGDYYWSVVALDDLMGRASAQYAYLDTNDSIGNFAMIAMDDPYGRGVAEQFALYAEDLGGVLITEVYYEAGKADYRPEVTALFNGDPDTIFGVLWEDEARIIFKQANELGHYESVKGRWYCPYISDVVLTPAPGDIEELKGLDPTYSGFRGDKFVARVLAEHPDLVQPGYYPVKAYDMYQVAWAAINLAGTENREKINENLYFAFEYVVGLASPDLKVDEDGMQMGEWYGTVVFKNGELQDSSIGKIFVEAQT